MHTALEFTVAWVWGLSFIIGLFHHQCFKIETQLGPTTIMLNKKYPILSNIFCKHYSTVEFITKWPGLEIALVKYSNRAPTSRSVFSVDVPLRVSAYICYCNGYCYVGTRSKAEPFKDFVSIFFSFLYRVVFLLFENAGPFVQK